MRKKMNRVLGFALSVLLVAGMLPISALAADCEHKELNKGVCKECSVTFAAQTGDQLYKELADAVQAAAEASDPAVVVLTDLSDVTMELGKAYLVVKGDEPLTFKNCVFSGEHEKQILLNQGKLTLENVSVENTAGDYAVIAECTQGDDLKEMTLRGGKYEGQKYGFGLKHMHLMLNAYPAQQEAAEAQELQEAAVPVISGETAAFQMEDSVIEVLCNLGEETSYAVDCVYPGMFAFASEYEGANLQASWFKCLQAENTYRADEKNWELPGAIDGAVTLGETTFTYNGKAQAPAVSAKLYNKALAAEHFTVKYIDENGEAVEEAVNAGKYKVVVSGTAPYSGTYQKEFEIKAAQPVITWDKESEQLEFTGKKAELTAKAAVQLVNGETYTGEIEYAYREGSTGDFENGLPEKQGTYEVKASVKANGNYTAAESAKPLKLTIGQKADAALTLEISIPAGGFAYTGSEIRPEVTVKDGETVVPAEEYDVVYQNNINVGTATVTVKAKANGKYSFADLNASFAIKKADAATLTIGGQPAAVTYGDKAFQLTAAGGISGAAVVWSVTEGSEIASVTEDGTVSVSGVGKVTVKAAQSGGAHYNDQSAEYTFEVKPAVLTVSSVTAENKTYDGNKAVKIKTVVLDGVLGADEVSAAVESVKGELAEAKAGVYEKVTVSNLTLTGKDAANYTVTQPAAPVKTDVTVSKAEIPTALAEIKSTVTADTAEFAVENLAVGMPADAGKLTFTNKNQDTGDGSEVIVLDWKVDENGKLTSKVISTKAGDQVIYDVTISSENYKDTVVRVVVTFGSQQLDASKVTVTPEKTEFVYDGKEHKPAAEVKYGTAVLKAGTDYEITYPKDCVVAGEKELTVTFKGDYSGTATAKYTVTKAKVTVSSVQAENKTYDGTTTAKVTATLSGVISGDDVKVTATGIFADKNSGSNKSITVTYKLSGDDAGNYELAATTGTTTAKISPVSASALSSQISGLSLSNADSGNKSALQTVVNRANAALADTGLSASEKSALSNVKWSAEDMINRIESAASAASTESIRKSADITKENVTMNDKPLLEKAQSDLNNALTTYSGNYTKAEETDIGNKKTRIADALTVITRVQSAQTMIGTLPAEITEETVIDAAMKNSVEDAKTAYDSLSDYEKSLLGEDAALKLTAAVEAAGNSQTAEPEKDEANTLISAAPEEGEGFKFPTWILVVAVIAAGLCGGGLFIYKRKQEENEYNW